MKIIGAMVVGEVEEKYLRSSLLSLKSLTDEIIVCLNTKRKKESQVIKSLGIKFYEDLREWGLNQPKIKEHLHRYVGSLNPDWILCLDSDEVYDKNLTRAKLEELTLKNEYAWHFYMVNLWEDGYRPDMCFWKVQFYKNVPKYGYKFMERRFDPGLVPEWAATHAYYASYLIKHYGLIIKSQRQKRIERYEKYDPKQEWLPKVYYDQIRENFRAEPFNEDKLHQMVVDEVSKLKLRKPNITMPEQKFVYVRRLADGATLDMPLKDWEDIKIGSRKNEFEFVAEVSTEPVDMSQVPVIDNSLPYVCSVCGYAAKNQGGLNLHSKKHK